MTMTEERTVEAGLKGVLVADTTIGEVRGAEGFYHYRQYSAIDLATSRSFEDVWKLLLDGSLPSDGAERSDFEREVRSARELPAEVWSALRSIAAVSAPLEGLRTALSLLASVRGLRPVLDLRPEERGADALMLAAATPTVLAAMHRLGHGQEPVRPRDDLGHAANYLWMLSGGSPAPQLVTAIERYLISTIDHGFNASTFTARVVTSTGADVGAAVVAALGALSGPLHGGAPSRALELLGEIGSVDHVEAVVRAKLASGERLMGFGHAVYRTEDPRAAMLRKVALSLGGPLAQLAVEVEARVVDLLAELKPGRRLHANVEYYASVVMAACGVPPSMFTPTFASSRVVGWTAHVLEQAASPGIIRPSARYVGPPAPAPVPAVI